MACQGGRAARQGAAADRPCGGDRGGVGAGGREVEMYGAVGKGSGMRVGRFRGRYGGKTNRRHRQSKGQTIGCFFFLAPYPIDFRFLGQS